MTTSQATKIYDIAYQSVQVANISFIKKAVLINENLIEKYGEEKADEIIDLVFENEFQH